MDISAWVDLVSIAAILLGLIIAGFELRQFRRLRARESALHLYQTFQTPEMAERILERESGTPAIPGYIEYKDWKEE